MRTLFRQTGLLVALTALAFAELRTETFDSDPGWDGLNNRSQAFDRRTVKQDFGYAAVDPFGDGSGAIGGSITPDGSPAYYAKPLAPANLDAPLAASGVVKVEKGAGNFLLGFFNADTVNEWRTPNSIAFRINGRGDVFHVHVEYATSKWRAGATVIGRHDFAADRVHPLEIPSGGVHTWSLAYDPAAADGRGAVVATFDDQRAECPLGEGHKDDGATFNRFGLLNVVKHADSPGTAWIGHLAINGETEDLARAPHWDALRNRATYETEEVRPRFNFGFSDTHYAGGAATGELGGLFFRGDCREPERLAYCGAELGPLTLEKPLRASGTLALRRAVSDSTTLLGFFHSKKSVRVNPSQKSALPVDFLGVCIQGPSADGFYVYPVYRTGGGSEGSGIPEGARLIYPDGTPHEWVLEYQPGDAAAITFIVDGAALRVPVPPDHGAEGATFDRFGLVTPWIDGNGQRVYFDDLTFTAKQ